MAVGTGRVLDVALFRHKFTFGNLGSRHQTLGERAMPSLRRIRRPCALNFNHRLGNVDGGVILNIQE
jgi:hypothetical protein